MTIIAGTDDVIGNGGVLVVRLRLNAIAFGRGVMVSKLFVSHHHLWEGISSGPFHSLLFLSRIFSSSESFDEYHTSSPTYVISLSDLLIPGKIG